MALAWGAGAFGSNYPWAYYPLLIACVVSGVAGLALGKGTIPRFLVTSFCLIGLAIFVQLIPLNESQLSRVSPNALTVVRARSLAANAGISVSHALSIEPKQTQVGLMFFGAFGLLLLGTARILNRDLARRLAALAVGLGAILAVVGIIQRATFNGKIYGFWELRQGGSPFGPFVNKNHFAGWMLMTIPIALGLFAAIVSRSMKGRTTGFRDLVLWLSTERASRAILVGFATLLMMLSLVLTLSRSGITALVLALLIAGSAMIKRERGSARRAVMVGYLLAVVIAVVSWVGLDIITARFADVSIADVNQRPAIWADTLRIIRDFWSTGTGLNTYGVITLYYQTSIPEQHLQQAHNDYLQIASEGGLLLGIPVLIGTFAFVKQVRRQFAYDVGSIWWIRMGAVTGLVAIAFQSAVEFSLQMPGNAAMFAVIAGLAIHDDR